MEDRASQPCQRSFISCNVALHLYHSILQSGHTNARPCRTHASTSAATARSRPTSNKHLTLSITPTQPPSVQPCPGNRYLLDRPARRKGFPPASQLVIGRFYNASIELNEKITSRPFCWNDEDEEVDCKTSCPSGGDKLVQREGGHGSIRLNIWWKDSKGCNYHHSPSKRVAHRSLRYTGHQREHVLRRQARYNPRVPKLWD